MNTVSLIPRHPTPVLLPGKSHGQRSLVGCSPWGRWESDTTEWLHFHFSLTCMGEGNGCPLQCSCLENPRDGGAWWAAVYGIAQSRTRLKWLSSSSSSTDEKQSLSKMTVTFFCRKKKLVLKFMCNYKRPEIAKTILKKKIGRFHYPVSVSTQPMYHGNSNQDCVVLR